MFQVSLLKLDDPQAKYSKGISLNLLAEDCPGDPRELEMLEWKLKEFIKEGVTIKIEKVVPKVQARIQIGRVVDSQIGRF